MPRSRIPEPCLCGDPECPRCFPESLFEEDDYFDESLADEDRHERLKERELIEDENAPV